MNARQRGDSTENGTVPDAEGPLRRWARRKREVAREKRTEGDGLRREEFRDPSEGAHGGRASTVDTSEPAAVEEKILTDADMPPLDTLDENSDYSGFLSSGVSEALRRRALRKLFSSAVFNIPDGLDDYDDDFTTFAALGDIVTSDMRHQQEVEAERARQAQADSEPAAAAESEPARVEGSQVEGSQVEGSRPADAGDREEDAPGVASADLPDASESPVPGDFDAPAVTVTEAVMEPAQAAQASIPAGGGARGSDSAGAGPAAGVAFEDRRSAPPQPGSALEEGVSTGPAAASQDGAPSSDTNDHASGGAEVTTDADTDTDTDDTDHGQA